MRRLRTSERGALAAEYTLLVAAIAVVLIAGLGYFGAELADLFGREAKGLAHYAGGTPDGS